MDHAAVVTGLVASDAELFFEDDDARIGTATSDLPSGGQPDDAGSDDDEPVRRQGTSLRRGQSLAATTTLNAAAARRASAPADIRSDPVEFTSVRSFTSGAERNRPDGDG
jgi:hypothetical protein